MNFFNPIPFAQFLGFELVEARDGMSEMTLDMRPELLNSGNAAHGGLLMSLMDVGMAQAARSLFKLPDDAPAGALPDTVTTIEMKTSFMRPGLGDRLITTAKVLTQTMTLSFCEAAVRNPEGDLIAHATGTFKRLKPRPAR